VSERLHEKLEAAESQIVRYERVIDTLRDQRDRLVAQLDREHKAREQMIRLVDDVVSECDPALRDSLLIQLGTSGLLQIPAGGS
jgi:hypothetical protein